MKLITLPAPYPTFDAYMRQFGKNLLYSLPAVGLVFALDIAINVAAKWITETSDDNPYTDTSN